MWAIDAPAERVHVTASCKPIPYGRSWSAAWLASAFDLDSVTSSRW